MKKQEKWEVKFDEKFNRFPDTYYDFVLGKYDTKFEDVASDLEDIKAFIHKLLEKERKMVTR